MRATLLSVAVLLAGCSSVYPSDDFSVAPCGPEMRHWQAPPPCGRGVLTCLGACAEGDTACEDACYATAPGCAGCVINEAVLCFRESGCEPEYEEFTCCADAFGCGYGDDACLARSCDIEVSNQNACMVEIGTGCDQVVVDTCVQSR